MKNTLATILVFLLVDIAFAGEHLTFVRIESLAEQEVAENLLGHVYGKLGIDISVNTFPGKRANAEVTSGRADGEAARIYSYGENNPTLIRVPTPYGSLETTAFALKERNISVTRKDDLKNYRIAVVRGVQHTADITYGLQEVEELNDICVMMQFIKSGRADIALTNTLSGIGALKRMKTDDIVAVGTLEELDLYHYLTPKHRDIVPAVDAVIRGMLATGELKELRARSERLYLENIR